jgi:hypothetical protein
MVHSPVKMMPSENAIRNNRAGRLFPSSIVGIAFSAALSQFVMIGLLGLLLLPVFFSLFSVGCWRVRRQEPLSGSALVAGIVLLSSAAAVLVATFWGATLTFLTVYASTRPSFAPPSGLEWIISLALWLCALPGIKIGFDLWTGWPKRQVVFWTLAVGAVFPTAIVTCILLMAVLPMST